jgi:hypothetical protein
MRVHRLTCGLALVVLLGTMMPPVRVSAQEVSARAYLSPGASVGLGRQFVVNVEVSGAQTLSEQPAAPDLGRFAQFLGSTQQSSIRMHLDR